MVIDFFDFKREIAAIGGEIRSAVDRVLVSGRYILGEELTAFEGDFARLCGCPHGIGVANGTDALFLTLKACGIGPGDEVITVANTFAATALAIAYTGATPVFIDIGVSSHLIDPERIEAAVTARTKAILPVHLYGQCADMDRIMAIGESRGMFVIEDACQAHGAWYKGRTAGSLGHAAAFSFYPTKNLGAYGDAGMVVTRDEALHARVRMLRNYGQTDRYHHELKGYNSRLDELQAAVLRTKLTHLEAWNARRQALVERYAAGLKDIDRLPVRLDEGSTHVRHLYVITVEDRDALQAHLTAQGIGTLIHYPLPLHRQKAFADARVAGGLEHTEQRASQILSLPLHPWLTDDEVERVIASIKVFYRG